MKKLLCWIGLHSWVQDRPLSIIDGFPFGANYQTPKRHCSRCSKRQRWLPGYGGSEWGCWIGDSDAR